MRADGADGRSAATRRALGSAAPPAAEAGAADQRVGGSLIGAEDPSPFELINPYATPPLLLVCDHASRTIPAALAGLGLDRQALDRHIAWDIGAAPLTRALARRLEAAAVLAGYSRLVIDVNRQPGDPQSIVESSDGTVIPGNRALGIAELAARAETFHWPYHHVVDQAFARLRRIGPEPVLVSVHTFTPCLGGAPRPWDVGILWNHDPRLAVPLIDLLRREPGLCVGDNEPYSGRELAYTLNLHAGAAGLPNAAIEVRQDHCATETGVARWAELLAGVITRILRMPHLHRIVEF